MRLGLALRAFWQALTDPQAAEALAAALDQPPGRLPSPPAEAPSGSAETGTAEAKPAGTRPTEAKPAETTQPTQHPAVTLLAALQREARLVDLIHENLDAYGDAQVGAAARPCLKQTRESLGRLMAISRVIDAAEGQRVEIPAGASAASVARVGSDSEAAGEGKLIHAGWRAGQIDLPVWSGRLPEADVIAPAQVET